MSYFVVDVEADGPIPARYSMLEFGVIKLTPNLKTQYYSGRIRPITDFFDIEALNAIDADRDLYLEHGREPQEVMNEFSDWLVKNNTRGRPIFFSDNVAFDWQFINYYFHTFIGSNPFGYSGRRIGDLYCGMQNDMVSRWKHLRTTEHTHHPLDDALGNAEALLRMKAMGLKFDVDPDDIVMEDESNA